MNFFKSRLRRLEQRAGGGPCPQCGLSPGGPDAKRIVGTYPEDDRSALVEEALAECCDECGLPEVVHLRIVYEGAEEGRGP